MKRALMVCGVLFGATLLGAGSALASTQAPGLHTRHQRQERRIAQGIRSGQLTVRETRRLRGEQACIGRAARRMRADGRLSRQERFRLHRMQNRSSRDIYRLKHNRRTRI